MSQVENINIFLTSMNHVMNSYSLINLVTWPSAIVHLGHINPFIVNP